MVLLYYELCEKLWRGSPATQQLDTGIESTDLNDVTDPTPSPTGSSGNGEADEESTRDDSIVELTDEGQRQEQTVNSRRQYLDRKLSGHKTEKMKRKLPIDVQVLACAKEDLAVKKDLSNKWTNLTRNIVRVCKNLPPTWKRLEIPLQKVAMY